MTKVLKVEDVSKQYRLGEVGTGTISHDLNRFWHKLRGKEDPYLELTQSNDREVSGGTNFVWALKNISFELNQGDVLGIIGKNGAGKSTLLKILSRITTPTKGHISIKGRMSSLLEVGTGFHPELTGRENIFLNGAILGMTKKEVSSKLEEIVDFSGCARYIDTPVKRYSSGMIVRLGFAVAANLESEILVVDEVLAVGDQEFQNKCIGKMQDISKGGRTVLFVSHNIGSVRSLCSKGLLISNGNTEYFGSIDKAIDLYLKESLDATNAIVNLSEIKNRLGNQLISFTEVAMYVNGDLSSSMMIGDSFTFRLKMYSKDKVRYRMAIQIFAFDEFHISNTENLDSDFVVEPFLGERMMEITFKDIRLYPGKYKIGLWIGDSASGAPIDYLKNCCLFEVLDGSTLVKRQLPINRGLYYFTPDWRWL